ncbi:MAG: recombinase family protein [Thermoplasmata archaeon]
MTRVAIYARVSTKEQTTETQVAQLTAYCQARAWTDVAVFRDDGISGVRDNRPELDRLRGRMIGGEFSAVVVSKMDRLGRSLGMILRFWDDADVAGARVIVVDQGIDTSTPAVRLQRNMLAALAEFERELILERTRAGIARARALGKKFGAPRRIPEAVASEVRVRRERGESLRMISQRMNLKLGGVRSVLRREHRRHPSSLVQTESLNSERDVRHFPDAGTPRHESADRAGGSQRPPGATRPAPPTTE